MNDDTYRAQHDLSPLSSGMRVPINLPLDHIDGIRSILRTGTEQIIRSHGSVSPQQRQNLHAFAADAYGAAPEQVALIAQSMNNPRRAPKDYTLKLTADDRGRCGAMAEHLGVSLREVGAIAIDMLWRELGMDGASKGTVN